MSGSESPVTAELRGGGLTVVAVGILQVTGVWSELISHFQTVVAGCTPALARGAGRSPGP